MKCDNCGCEIEAEFAKTSKGYCKSCDDIIANELLAQMMSVPETERMKLADALVAEAISRNMDERLWNQA